MENEDRKQAYEKRYYDAAARVTKSIGSMPEHPNQSIKQMRVGIDLTKSDMSALVRLLIEKGVFTEVEYYGALATAAEKEAADCEAEELVFLAGNMKTVS